MSEFFTIIFGDYTAVQLFGFLWFFVIGYLVYGLIETSGRDVQGTRTPKKWSWKFWLKDNLKRYLTTILASYVLFRFYAEMSGHEFGNLDALTFGLLGDGLSATLKKRLKWFKNDRTRLMQTMDDHVVVETEDDTEELG